MKTMTTRAGLVVSKVVYFDFELYFQVGLKPPATVGG